jgi:hypothetical protein
MEAHSNLRPRAPPPRLGWTSRVTQQPAHSAQLSKIAGCAAHPARAGRRSARRKLRDARAAARPSHHCTCLAALTTGRLAEHVSIRVEYSAPMRNI